jgi:predicted dehydrogenase
MVNVGVVGVGKMGLSHLAILNAHPDVRVVGVCDTSGLVLDALEKYGSFNCFTDFKTMLNRTKPDAVVVSVPTRFHAQFIQELLERNIHVFTEKPFCMTPDEGRPLLEMAEKKQLVNQVGYHNKFIGTFHEAKRLAHSGSLGEIYHFLAESYGPVVTRPSKETWRSKPAEGGGCLMDYASHVIDLLNEIVAPVDSIRCASLKRMYSQHVEDAVYAVLQLENNITGMLSVNWSDETYRKMSTSLTLLGTNGKIIVDATELKVYFKGKDAPKGYSAGWNNKYITDFAEHVDFYLRGEEYSAQLDYFIKAVLKRVPNTVNTFADAYKTDQAIHLLKNY